MHSTPQSKWHWALARVFIDEVEHLLIEFAFAALVAFGDRVVDAVFEVLVHEFPADAAEGLLDGGDLHQDVHAVTVVFDHFRDAADLAFNSLEPLERGFFAHYWNLRRRRLLASTLSELSAMAANGMSPVRTRAFG